MYRNASPSYIAEAAPRATPEDGVGEAAHLIYLEVQVPRALHDAVVRHHANLVSLSDALRGAGMPNAVIAAHVDSAMASYREALIASLSARETSPNAA